MYTGIGGKTGATYLVITGGVYTGYSYLGYTLTLGAGGLTTTGLTITSG